MNGEYEFGVLYCIQRNGMKKRGILFGLFGIGAIGAFKEENHLVLFERSLGCFLFSPWLLPLPR